MGLFATGATLPAATRNRPSDSLLHRMGCTACPLNKAELCSPKMSASGSEEPLIYCLGEFPNSQDDREGRQFVGPSGDLIRSIFPAKMRSKIRWNNVIQCCPPNNRDPDKVEVEACRQRIVADVERTKPVAIFGFGAVPLSWTGRQWIELWRGRRFPIKVGSHTCWYYAMRHPSFILHMKNSDSGRGASDGRDEELALSRDIQRAVAEVDRGLPKPVVHSPEFSRKDITCLKGGSSKELDYLLEFLEYAGTCKIAGVDYETQGLRPYRKSSKILTMAVSVEDETVSFAWRHPQARWTQEHFEILEKAWLRFLKSKAIKAVHHLAFEQEWTCKFYGPEYAREVPWECTETQAFVLDERSTCEEMKVKPGAMSLTFLTQQYFGIDLKKLTPGLKKDNMEAEPLTVLLPYNGMDSKYHRWVWQEQDARIDAEGLRFQYEEKLRQVPTIVLSQIKGLPIDRKANEVLARMYEQKLLEAERSLKAMPEVDKFRRITGHEFNPSSPQDVIVVLRDVLQTREGQEGKGWSTSEDVLSKIDSPFGAAEIVYRKVLKLKSTYVEPYAAGSHIVFDDGLLHANFGTTQTVTGRLNCEDPNLQNLPIRAAEAKKVRRQIADAFFPHSCVASFDMGQIDGRLIACGSRDKTYCKALWEDYDIHAEWARRLALAWPDFVGGKKGLSDKKAMEDFRQIVKSVWIFALFYGATLFTTAGRLRVDESVLRRLYEEFWKVFAGVKTWQEQISKQYKELGYVELFNGLRRRGPISHGQAINCVDTETECLTEEGWKTVDGLKIGDRIYTKNPNTGRIELQECFGIIRSPYKGEVCVLDGSVSAITTPNHRWLVDKRSREWTVGQGYIENIEYSVFTTSEEFKTDAKESRLRIHMSGEAVEQKGGIWTDDEVRFAGWLLTDGCFQRHERAGGRVYTQAIICQSERGNPTKVQIIDDLFARLFDGNFSYDDGNSFNKTRFYCRRVSKVGEVFWSVYNSFVTRLYEILPDRILTPSFLSQLSTQQLFSLYETMLLGDGCWYKGECRRFSVGKKQAADMFSMLCVLIGKPHNLKHRNAADRESYPSETKLYPSMGNIPKPSSYWIIQFKKRDRSHPQYGLSWDPEFDGEVWCPQVLNQTFVARRKGKIYITGNSPIQGATNRVVMLAMNKLSELGDPVYQANLQLHDDLTFILRSERELEDAAPRIVDTMLDAHEFDWICIPLTVDVKYGPNWADQEKIGTFSSHKRLKWPVRAKEFT